MNKWASQRGDRAKFYLVEHVQYIYIYTPLHLSIYIYYIHIYNLYVCVSVHINKSVKDPQNRGRKKKPCLQGHTQAGHAFQVPEKSKAKARAVPTQRNIGRKKLLYIVSNPQKKCTKIIHVVFVCLKCIVRFYLFKGECYTSRYVYAPIKWKIAISDV